MSTIRPPIAIVDYDPNWPKMFTKEKAAIHSAIGDKAMAIEHVGSTSVTGLGSKPIIDIMIGTRNLADADACIEPLHNLGYEYVPEFEDEFPERRYFRKRSMETGKITYHIHMVETSSEFWRKQIVFRDYLRSHPQTARDYLELKKRLAKEYGSDVNGYADAKTSFVEHVLNKAEAK